MAKNPPNDYKDPYWTNLSTIMEKKHGLPSGLLVNIVQKGEKTNNDKKSPVGAQTVYQIMPNTRNLFLKKYGVDAFESPRAAAEVAALHLKESLDRNKGDVAVAVREYHGGPNRSGWGKVNDAYVGRVLGGGNQSTAERPSRLARARQRVTERKELERPSLDNIYRAYKNGDMSAKEAKDYERDVQNGSIMLSRGQSLKGGKKSAEQKGVKVPQAVADAYYNGEMDAQAKADLERDRKAGLITLPTPTKLQSTVPDFDANNVAIPQPTEYTGGQGQTPTTLGQDIVGAGEAGLALATGAVGGTVGQVAGTFRGAAENLINGEMFTPQGGNNMARRASEGAEALTYAPRTEAGQNIVGGIGEALGALPPTLGGGVGTAVGTLGKASAPVARVVANDVAQAAKPAVVQATQAVQQGASAVGNAVKAGAGKVAGAVGMGNDTPPVSTAANIGAAQVDPATVRQALNQELPVKYNLTKGEASRDPLQLTEEHELMKLEQGIPLRENKESNIQVTKQNFDAFIDEVGAENFDKRSTGIAVDKALKGQMTKDKARVDNAYTIADKSSESAAIVDPNGKLKPMGGKLIPDYDDDLSTLRSVATRTDGEVKQVPNGISILHGSGDDKLSVNSIDIVRANGQKQGKKGRVYGGFYGAPRSALNEAEGYASMQGGTPTVYEVRIKPNTKVLEKNGDITRLSEGYIDTLKKEGIGVVVGKDPRGRVEYAVIDKDAISIMGKYDAAQQGSGGLIDYLNNRPNLDSTPIIGDAKRIAVQLGIAGKGSDGKLVPLKPTVKQMEEFRKEINHNTKPESANVRQSVILKNYIDAHVAPVAGKLYEAARQERVRFAKKWENNAIVGKLINTKKGTSDRVTALEDIQKAIIHDGSLDDLRVAKRALMTSGDSGRQAWKDVQASTLQDIIDSATSGVTTNTKGESVVSAGALDKSIQKLAKDGKLKFIFGEKGAEKIQAVNEINKAIATVPAGTPINWSGTAGAMKAMISDMLAGSITGMPLPVVTAMKVATNHIKDRKIKAQVREALNLDKTATKKGDI